MEVHLEEDDSAIKDEIVLETDEDLIDDEDDTPDPYSFKDTTSYKPIVL
jgi:hypothetical protein